VSGCNVAISVTDAATPAVAVSTVPVASADVAATAAAASAGAAPPAAAARVASAAASAAGGDAGAAVKRCVELDFNLRRGSDLSGYGIVLVGSSAVGVTVRSLHHDVWLHQDATVVVIGSG